MVTCVTPGGTTKSCFTPAYSNLIVPAHVNVGLHSNKHAPPEGQVVAQSAQTTPEPHAVVKSPPAQVPPVSAEQQPPLQGWVAEQLAVHICATGSQARGAVHWLACVHPQTPGGMHALPA